MHPESILRALEERARNGEGPHGLTALYAAGQGDSDSRGLNHLGVEGLCRQGDRRPLGALPQAGPAVRGKQAGRLQPAPGGDRPAFPGHCAGKPGVITHVGLGTL